VHRGEEEADARDHAWLDPKKDPVIVIRVD